MQSSANVTLYIISHLQELQTIGLPSVLVGKSTQPNTVQLVNTVYRLLQLHRHSTKSIDELKARYVHMGFVHKVIYLYQYFDASRVTFVKCRDASLYLAVQHYINQGIWDMAAVFQLLLCVLG